MTSLPLARITKAVLGTAAVLALGSCGEGKPPFLMLQMCLHNQAGVEEFKRIMQSIALDERLKHIDSSDATQRDLKAMDVSGPNMHSSGGLIYVGVEGDDGLGLEGGNLGLNTYDVAIGFNGPDLVKARAFAEFVRAKLAKRWTLKVVPPNSGAFPDPDCASG